jgi:hypothetical protein
MRQSTQDEGQRMEIRGNALIEGEERSVTVHTRLTEAVEKMVSAPYETTTTYYRHSRTVHHHFPANLQRDEAL